MAWIRRRVVTLVFSFVFLFTLLHVNNLSASLDSTSSSSSPSATRKQQDVPNWFKRHVIKNPVKSMVPLPTTKPVSIPKIQFEFGKEDPDSKAIREDRRDAVKKAFLHTWKGYKDYAWLMDELAPVNGGVRNPFGGWGATLVDSLDTLWLMGLEKEFKEAVAAVRHIDFSSSDMMMLNVFETNIRYLGGFLAAYDLTEGAHPILLQKAVEVGDLLYVAFDTPNRMPVLRWYWPGARDGDHQESSTLNIVAELGSLSVEFTRLSQITKDPKYYDAIQRITNLLQEHQFNTKIPGMWPLSVDTQTPSFERDRRFTFGGMADSLYEYLPKEYLLLGGRNQQYKDMYEKAIEVAKKHIFFRPMTKDSDDILISGTAYIGGTKMVTLRPEGQHLTCFVGGMVALAAKVFNRPEELDIARKLTEGCIWAYKATPSGVMPETFEVTPCEDPTDCKWRPESWFIGEIHEGASDSDYERMGREQGKVAGFSAIIHGGYSLRPEAIESVFILYRITGDKTLQDKGWEMFSAIEQHAKTDFAYGGLDDVTSPNPRVTNEMESFWTGETLKYFYLLFSEPDLASLDKYVFNTEAHPLLMV
ncbi:mannosyl-oligosaccharide alpha-1,2-mannosidase [[Emmonsia] crescens]|uniref:alpha-1,2-Mannosidase n=1 Tax=[Emmonsia] crescens TaxID=73230 RepID=A0A0G2JBK1_9EURO|nr:mannosyl-oligosaccharide alpha-1,2-mannosidase [Emmonsia crescens UAMH 3008]